MFTQDYMLQSIYVKGEVSNCKYHPTGHIYFTLKDPRGTISCVMFARNRSGLKFQMTEGQQVVVYGSVDVYERDGKYELYAKKITLDGDGALYEQFERLKRELQEMGMFAQEYKRPLPKYIRTLGVVTSDSGAAVRDIIQVTRRRNPYVQIILYSALVQGQAAAESIVQGIRALERMQVDVMIVGRGGGSMEDLSAFNERCVAEAVFQCRVPVISAVGHESDTTIIDFVADVRASTPSVAAELAVTDVRQLLERLTGYDNALRKQMRRKVAAERDRCLQYERELRHLNPMGRIRANKTYVARVEDRLRAGMERVLTERRHMLALYVERMKGLSPLEKLSSGYSYVEDAAGHNVRSVKQAREGDKLQIWVKDGCIGTVVTGTSGKDGENDG